MIIPAKKLIEPVRQRHLGFAGALLGTAGLFLLMRLSETATIVDIDLQLSAGNRRQSRSEEVLRGCEGPRSDAKVASDPGAPSHFSTPAR